MDIIMAIIGGGVGAAIVSAISAILQAKQQRKYQQEDKHDELAEQLDKIEDQLNALSDKIDRNSAVTSRMHILRFDDELLNKVRHSKEYFKQILDDIDTYERFCTAHPAFKNGYTVAAVAHIRETYAQCLEENSFI